MADAKQSFFSANRDAEELPATPLPLIKARRDNGTKKVVKKDKPSDPKTEKPKKKRKKRVKKIEKVECKVRTITPPPTPVYISEDNYDKKTKYIKKRLGSNKISVAKRETFNKQLVKLDNMIKC